MNLKKRKNILKLIKSNKNIYNKYKLTMPDNKKVLRNRVNKIRAREGVMVKTMKKLRSKEATLMNSLQSVQKEMDELSEEGRLLYDAKMENLKKLKNLNNKK
jgi:uncharacterized protein YlxW (UPF0749 family)